MRNADQNPTGPFSLTFSRGSLVLMTGTYQDRGPDFVITSVSQLRGIVGDSPVKSFDNVPFYGARYHNLTVGERAVVDSVAHWVG